MITLNVNGKSLEVAASPDTPLLWVLREELQLTGTKYSCGEGLCGACTVHVGGEPTRSCITTLAEVKEAEITTIEGLAEDHPVKRAWLDEEVSQCGYCQPGQIMGAAALLRSKPLPTDADIDAELGGNLCRCGTYPRIRKAVHLAAAKVKGGGK
jgi:aerobic-type carbon monoxide dehydrogenase small subunit (CoxS/CutS family)